MFRHVVARGEVTRQVVCDHCRHAYAYVLKRSAALDTIPFPPLVRSAERITRERVARRLAADVDPHPCPACGRMQAHMVPELRRRFLSPLRTWGVFFSVSCASLAAISLAVGLYFRAHPTDFDLDWFGVAAASSAGAAFGVLMILARRLLGVLRYRAARPAPSIPLAGAA